MSGGHFSARTGRQAPGRWQPEGLTNEVVSQAFPLGEGGFDGKCLHFSSKTDEVGLQAFPFRGRWRGAPDEVGSQAFPFRGRWRGAPDEVGLQAFPFRGRWRGAPDEVVPLLSCRFVKPIRNVKETGERPFWRHGFRRTGVRASGPPAAPCWDSKNPNGLVAPAIHCNGATAVNK